MGRGHHRAVPVRRSLLRGAPRRVRVAAGLGAGLVASASAVAFWLNTGAAPGVVEVAPADVRRHDLQDGGAFMDVDALRAAAVLRGEGTADRASRNGTRSPLPTATVTTASPSPSVPAVVGKMWATTDVTVRSGPSADQDRIASLQAVTQVGVTGATQNGWTQVVVDGRAGWVKSTYLSASKPESVTPAGVSSAPCSISSSIEAHLTSNARAVYRAVCAAFGTAVSSFGGYRAGDSGDHGSGRAVDIMVSGAAGTEIAKYVQAHARELGVTYVIYQQKIWLAGNPTSQWKLMEDRGSPTANHMDHVHVSVS